MRRPAARREGLRARGPGWRGKRPSTQASRRGLLGGVSGTRRGPTLHEYVCCTGSTLRISSTVPVSTTFASSSRRSSARSGHVPSALGRARAATTRSSSSGCSGAEPDGHRLAMARAEDGGRRPEQARGPGRAGNGTRQDGTQLQGGGGSAGGAGAGPGAAPPPPRLLTSPSPAPQPAPVPGPPGALRPAPAANKASG